MNKKHKRYTSSGCGRLRLSAPRKRNRGENFRAYRERKRLEKEEGKTVLPPDNSVSTDTPTSAFEINGKRIVDIKFFMEQLKQMNSQETRLQRDSPAWLHERRKRLTASHFGSVCIRLAHTSCKNLVKAILYSNFDNRALR
ncbi:hypothetical protein JTE90_003600 [Oedothorax gibbosus]|uniref:Uncharacterized protein n=1 Tax=Oedothorax gibbosus TaxID=931172 RepID=A0AAV6VBM9_9ARAC|nr:hypothetical protein JTE90_003600 [Oedothorax gibbosus]